MALSNQVTSESIEAVQFGFLTADEVRRHSVKQITNPVVRDPLSEPLPGGLYDPAMGPYDSNKICKTCGQRSNDCPGHCGHIELVNLVYNPMLFDKLYNIIGHTCFYCLRFRMDEEVVKLCISQLKMIAKGDIIGARRLDEGRILDTSTSPEDGETSDFQDDQSWSSLQFTEASSVLKKFFKPKPTKCKRCSAKNPKISKPTFGWFHMSGLSAADTRANIIRAVGELSVEKASHNEYIQEAEIERAESDSCMTNSVETEDSRTKRHVQNVKGASHSSKQKDTFSRTLLPSEVQGILKTLWANECGILSYICGAQHESLKITNGQTLSHSMFFIEALLVPPTKFRPPSVTADTVSEHTQTAHLGKVLNANIALGNAFANRSEQSNVVRRWLELQQSINLMFDSKTALNRNVMPGICQLLEKKEGIFRQKMMGKRVNHSCRSVISPDPYLAVNEIGIPPYFALRLTYPVRVTPWNAHKLREAIINGSEIHPGATNFADEVSNFRLPLGKKARVSLSRKLPSSRCEASAKSLEMEGKIVFCHMKDGDVVLVNRQPTLHKPSIMAHIVRVLPGEKTIRMHYANCSTYNADFDGDEMNVHLPQDEVSRAEAYNIVNANNQYIVPTRGDTVRGLIQDHIGAAVLLTMKDTFLTRDQYDQLLYSSGVFSAGPSLYSKNLSKKISKVESYGLHPVLPAVWKPKPLWTGKQVITSLLNHITRGCKPCTLENEGKIPYQYFSRDSGNNQPSKDEEAGAENKVLIRRNELVRGVIDKAQFGKYGLVHTVQELYGSDTAGVLLSALSRLFTCFLQMHGFTCGVDDLILLPQYDIQRKEELEGEDVGEEVHCDFVNFKRGKIGPKELQYEIEKVMRSNGESAVARLDGKMKNELREKGSKINKELLLNGLYKPFPKNCISLMTISGAKGSSVNFQQISSSLGQQELEGKRVPRMTSGKTLPSFSPWDFSSRAGGYITDRFLTGLRPQEYYFHCMAGREGLVDTAVKTSRSGYLQRCLVKNLECLKVCYDYTVRDADGSIVQFCYGEDGVDVHQTSFLNKFEALAKNREIIGQKFHHKLEYNTYIKKLPNKLRERVEEFTNISLKGQLSSEELKKRDLLMLMKQKYLSSLAQPGEPVGVIAAQSVGEPSTQMTLNTFHLAGRGEMNVTLGIPRLQEILMTATIEIKTPIVTCRLFEGKSKDDAKALVAKLKKVTVADIIESVEICVVPLYIYKDQICRLYKIKIKIKKHELVSKEDCQETLEIMFLRELEDAIENHVNLLSRISGIKDVTENIESTSASETGDAVLGNKSQEGDDDENGDDEGDDLGLDAQKRKRQASDEIDYEDGIDGKSSEVELTELESEIDEADDEIESSIGHVEDVDVEDEPSNKSHDKGLITEPTSTDQKVRSKSKKKKRGALMRKDSDRSCFVKTKGQHYEVHFKFINEPHILLSEIVQKVAKKVPLSGSGKIEHCQQLSYDVLEKQVLWEKEENSASKKRNKVQTDLSNLCALKAAGVNITALWEMQDVLDVNHIYSNNIHLMLKTYGVEVARKTIIKEVQDVFKIYGVEIDYRHLSLIADYMTHSGEYRPMSRHGMISESLSPLMKMSFETPSKFIVEAASHRLTDNLETPSARICLGLPVKLGTGSFDLMQNLQI
ncbi:DNA-directed RNA polymerase subunit [Heracleum sosnowskyi]|uniref:DNA-directed RNA polymerase subunit n=1 Tax=Heracleum sosnowskyi TaxID=360622 RepID=A0AAD8HGU1_9APIA|nr:DNA-directed RNA polymerase subunit [Heracleum sosnowskyi]